MITWYKLWPRDIPIFPIFHTVKRHFFNSSSHFSNPCIYSGRMYVECRTRSFDGAISGLPKTKCGFWFVCSFVCLFLLLLEATWPKYNRPPPVICHSLFLSHAGRKESNYNDKYLVEYGKCHRYMQITCTLDHHVTNDLPPSKPLPPWLVPVGATWPFAYTPRTASECGERVF